MKIINNADKLEKQINEMELVGVEAVSDDGSVCIQVEGSLERVKEVANIIGEKFARINSIGDGRQNGEFWINNKGFNGELSEALSI